LIRDSPRTTEPTIRRSVDGCDTAMEANMGRGVLLWLIGIPLPIILLIWLLGGLHG